MTLLNTQINPKTGLPFKTTLRKRQTAKIYKIASKQTVSGRAVVLVNNARSRSVKKNIKMEVSREWVEEHLTRGTCQITGIPFNLAPPSDEVTRRWDAPSLDRISKHKHYTEDNTRVILWAVNCALAEYGTEIMLPVLKAMVKGIESAQEKSVTPVSNTNHQQSEDNPQPGTIPAPRTWEDRHYPDDYRRPIPWQDTDRSAKESS